MPDYIHVSIIGLSLTATNKLKTLMQNAYYECEIRWTNIADPHLNVLIVSEAFIDSPIIKQYSEKKLPILSVQSKATQYNVIIENTLFLPFDNQTKLTQWLNKHLNQQNNSTKYLLSSNTAQIPLIETLFPLWSINTHAFYVLNFNQNAFLIDTRKQEIWVDQNFNAETISSITLQVVDFNKVVQLRYKKQRYDLRYWLWNQLWQNLPTGQFTLTNIVSAKLHHWPQPNLNTPKYTLKMAACFEHGAHVKDVLNYLQCSEKELNLFMTLGIACNLLKPSSNKEITFQQSTQNAAKSSVLRGFFSKMRKKLGL